MLYQTEDALGPLEKFVFGMSKFSLFNDSTDYVTCTLFNDEPAFHYSKDRRVTLPDQTQLCLAIASTDCYIVKFQIEQMYANQGHEESLCDSAELIARRFGCINLKLSIDPRKIDHQFWRGKNFYFHEKGYEKIMFPGRDIAGDMLPLTSFRLDSIDID